MKTALKQAKGLGSAHNGTGHWLLQRITAIALIPLFTWLTITLISSAGNLDFNSFYKSPLQSLLLVILFTTLLLHSTLGLQVVIEDYVHSEKVKITMLIFVKLFTIFTATIFVIAILSQYLKYFLT